MKYSWEFKLECVEKYKKGIRISKPDYSNCDSEHFSKQVLNWVKLFDAHGVDGLKCKRRGSLLRRIVLCQDQIII